MSRIPEKAIEGNNQPKQEGIKPGNRDERIMITDDKKRVKGRT